MYCLFWGMITCLLIQAACLIEVATKTGFTVHLKKKINEQYIFTFIVKEITIFEKRSHNAYIYRQ